MARPFNFRVYRLNIIHTSNLFNQHFGLVENDVQIARLLMASGNPKFDLIMEGHENVYKWAIRSVENLQTNSQKTVISFKIVRSIVREPTDVLTDESVHREYLDYDPPKAVSSTCLLYLDRHVVAIEYNSIIMQSEKWQENFSRIVAEAALHIELNSTLGLEPIPSKNEILSTFHSFTKLTRMRLYLRLPNPELSRHAEKLYSEMKEGGIREYLQDMKNPTGLSTKDEALPYAAANIAQKGYKKGDVRFEGIRNGQFEKISTGSKAARGSVPHIRDFIRGLRANTKSKEAARVLDAVAEELERVAPKPKLDESD